MFRQIRKLNTEMKRNFAKHSELSAEITDLKRHLTPWSEMLLTFEILHQLITKILFLKIIMRQVTVRGSDILQFGMSMGLFKLCQSVGQSLIILHSRTAKMNKYAPHCLNHKNDMSIMSLQVPPFCHLMFTEKAVLRNHLRQRNTSE